MLLCIDIGNTNTVLATFEGDQLVHSWRIKTDARVIHGYNPAMSLTDASHDASLLVIGHRGRGETRLPLGQVGRALIHHVHCSVAVIHPRTDGGQP